MGHGDGGLSRGSVLAESWYACWMELAHSSSTARSRLGCSCLGTPWPTSSSRSHLRRLSRCSASLVMKKVLPAAFGVIGARSPAGRSGFTVDERDQSHLSITKTTLA